MADLQQEEWRDIPGYEGVYQVSNMGRVRRIGRAKRTYSGRLKTLQVNRRGYSVLVLSVNGRYVSCAVHRLVMLAFVGPRPEGFEVNHKNGIKADNRLENLEYLTRKQNIEHSIEVLGNTHGFNGISKGEGNVKAKLTEDDVRIIRELHNQGASALSIARQFEVEHSTINRIVKRKNWKHI